MIEHFNQEFLNLCDEFPVLGAVSTEGTNLLFLGKEVFMQSRVLPALVPEAHHNSMS